MIFKSWRKVLLASGLLITLLINNAVFAGCCANPRDPLEPFNRVMFQFNDFIDRFILKPVAQVYNKIVPKPVAKAVGNFFSNLDTVPTIINDVLQLNIYQAANDSWRLGINSTIGIFGLFDVASLIGLEPNSEDFGLTLAHWGYRNSNYLVLPFLGPTTVRDAIAWPINYQYMSVYPYIEPTSVRYRLYLLSVISKRAELLRFETVLQQCAIDRYVFIRDAYLQRRNYVIERNRQLGDPYLKSNSFEECANPDEKAEKCDVIADEKSS